MKTLYDAADLVVARAGASTIAEIIQTGKPAILVPYPFATAQHQDVNAGCLAESNGAIVLRQRSSSDDGTSIPGLLEKLVKLMQDTGRLREMAAANRALANGCAASKIAEVLLEMVRPEGTVLRGMRRGVSAAA
jgi:UDP-N-acetylglucosamine--N-acetylmuramyl-(pentapeptide) pyrophosphoryl-undecaprenol N-acetylglucosamine transferase